MLWWLIPLLLLILAYTVVALAMVREWNKMNPYWNMRRRIHFVRTYWAWPVLLVWLCIMVLWEIVKIKFLRQL